ncbi:MAG: hypothetical protein LBE91_09460 [Tannerella sp.]|jgi:hypothetical protein|nr:hypothetical protein [Tannerella sp.]
MKFFTIPLLFFCFDAQSQELSKPENPAISFRNQLSVFPQEKIYLHTDKPFYITGEKIWFRTHLVNAENHIPASASLYVYVEMFNPVDSLISRVKIRNSNGAYYGYMDIPEDIPAGDYTLRAYTNFMRNLDENYLCTKTIRIGNPKNLLHVEPKFSFGEDGTTNVDFSFFDSPEGKTVVPKSLQMNINSNEMKALEVKPDGTAGVNFKMPVNASKRVMLLEADDPLYPARQFIQIPASDTDFDVTFYPEGGSLLQGVGCRVAFKALMSNGRPANVEGVLYDQHGNERGKISTGYMGMGSFIVIPEEGTSYYMVCTNDGQKTKRFELPAALKEGYALSVNNKNNIYVSVLKSATDDRHETLYLLAHVRGTVYYSERWDESREFIALPKKQLPSGVLHLVLFDAGLNPVSERLVFVNNDDQARLTYENDQKSFVVRSPVNSRITLTDHDGNPLSGSFSVSVTADNAVTADTVSNILTHLLLTSDLRGNIENPAAYFTDDRSMELDMLMMTQGWRRYDIVAMAKGQFAHPAIPIERSAEISGEVKGGLFLNKPSRKAKVSIVSSGASCFDLLETDSEGRFSYKGCDQPDSTEFIVRVVSKSNTKHVMLHVDADTFPEWTFPIRTSAEIEQESFQKYVEQAKEQDEKYKEDKWTLSLPEVTVTARHIPKSVVRASYIVDEKQIRKFNDLKWVLNTIPRVQAGGTVLYYGTPIRKLTVDDEINEPFVFESFFISQMLWRIKVEEVKSIYFSIIHEGMPLGFGQTLPPETELVIICKNIYDVFERKENNFKLIQPLGYQKPVEFYAPKYDTPEAREEETLDMRTTTVHWQPDVRTDSLGMAAFGFYTGDTESSCTVVIEGVTAEGKIIRHEEKILRVEK